MGSGGVSGIISRSYKAGSIVYFEGDKSEYIYILKSGKVLLTYIRPETGEEIKEDVRNGEFFGVKSSLGRYPREETAQTLTDTMVLQLRLDDFERIVLSNVQLVKKMLRVFSNQLRRVGKAQREILGETSVLNPEAELFKIGEYYFRNGRADQAIYAYKKYLEYYPNTQFSSMCMQRVKDIQSGNFSSIPDPDLGISEPVASPAESSISESVFESTGGNDGPSDMVDFDFDDGSSSRAGMHTELSSEMDNFLSSGSDFGLSSSPPPPEPASQLVEEGKALQQKGDHQNALDKFTLVTGDASPFDPHERESWEEAHVQVGVSLYNLGKLKEALNELTVFMKNYPQSKFVKNALLYSGYVFEKAGSKDKAIPYYKKVISMPPRDDLNAWAMNRLKAMGV
jgi:tetratricopeptide (TPR) repeat protein